MGCRLVLGVVRRALVLGVVGVAGCGVLAGCGAGTRHHRARVRPPIAVRSPIAVAQATHEYPSPPPPREHVSGGARSPVGAVAAFAREYINWSAGTVSADMRALAARSVGQARAAMQLAAAQTAGDYELRQGGIANRGTVEAVAPLAAHPGEFVVVTRELTTATATTAYQGLQPAWHVAIATVHEVAPGDWAVSGWQPKS